MAWLFSDAWPTRNDLIKELVRETTHFSALKYCCVGNNLWIVREGRLYLMPPHRHIVLYMMRRQASDVHNVRWGYKELFETEGPRQTNCPLSYIEMCTEPTNAYSREWREKVRKYHELRNRKLAIGDTFTYCSMQWQVCDTHGMQGWSITQLPEQGLVYRFHRRQMDDVTDIVKCQT